MRRILLISDTHGNLDIINEKVAQTNADMVIHAGDFGFYDDQSVYRLSPRELRLSVAHSPVWRQYDNLCEGIPNKAQTKRFGYNIRIYFAMITL